MNLNRKQTGAVLGALVLGLASYALVYGLKNEDPPARADPSVQFPGEDVTPEPGATPNFTEAFWYVPYQNAENQAAKFEGERNGIRITLDPEAEPTGGCGGDFRVAEPGRELEHAVNSEIGIPVRSLPAGVAPVSLPEVITCDGEPFHIIWSFDVKSGVENVGSAGSGLDIYRLKGTNEFFRPASEPRWQDITVGEHRGVLLNPVIVGPGAPIDGCWLALRDEQRDLLTVIWASAGLPEFCIAIAEVLS